MELKYFTTLIHTYKICVFSCYGSLCVEIKRSSRLHYLIILGPVAEKQNVTIPIAITQALQRKHRAIIHLHKQRNVQHEKSLDHPRDHLGGNFK